MAASRDCYEVLGVSKNAAKDEIKSSYRRLALKYHPDRNKGDKPAEEKFKEITHAYQILIDDEKRAAYDRYGFEGVNATAGFGEGFGGFSEAFSDIFEDFFGMGGPRGGSKRSARGLDLGAEIEITFREALFGVEKTLNVKRDEACRHCRGEGAEPGTKRDTCKTCRGSGQTTVSSGFFSLSRTCGTCGGQGTVVEKPCSACRGTGREATARTIKIKVPAGVDNGTRLRVSGEGEAGHRGGERGDLFVDIFVEPHEIFKRHGADLLCEMPVSFSQAALGAEVDVPTPYGTEKIKVPQGTQTGKVFRIKEKGVPHVTGRGTGDLHVRVVVETPTGLSAMQKELLMKFAEAAGEKVNPMSHSFVEKVKEFLKG